MAETNLIPRHKVTFEDFSRLAQRHGWKLDQRSARTASQDESPAFLWHIGGSGAVKLVQSATLNRCYVVIAGDEHGVLAAHVREAFPVFAPAEIIDRLSVARSAEDRKAALHLVAATATPCYDQTIYNAVCAGLEGSDPLVQLAALAAAFYCRWQQFEPMIERMVGSPRVGENVRIVARNLLGLTRWDCG
ncbi:hypothetical protein [Micromonospora rubida]